jgi:hypothetical protein
MPAAVRPAVARRHEAIRRDPAARRFRCRCGAILGLVAALLFGTAASKAADAPIGVRAGDHPGFGRLVFDFQGRVDYRVSESGDLVVLHFADAVPIGEAPDLPRNVGAFVPALGKASVRIAAGATIRTMRVGTRIVLDVLDPARLAEGPPPHLVLAAATLPLPPPPIPLPLPPTPRAEERGGAAQPAAAPAAPQAAAPAPVLAAVPSAVSPMAISPLSAPAATAAAAAAPVAAAVPSVSAPPGSVPARPEPEMADPGQLALAARRVVARDGAEAAFLVPFGPRTGAAAFRRGDSGYVVFDESRPIDMAALAGDPAVGAAAVTLLPAGTLLRVPLPPTLGLALWRREDGWVVGITAAPRTAHAIASKVAAGSLALPLATAARVVVMPDPLSGVDLLVGTAHVPGSAVAVTRRMPGFVLLRTWLGVAVEPLTDRLALHAGAGGFTLGTDPPGGLALSAQPAHFSALEGAATLTRRFDFPALPLGALARRLREQLDAAVAAPRLARFAPRLAEAKTMLALGMGPEAAALIRLAVTDDPRHANDSEVKGLSAIAALLAGRVGHSAGLDDPRLSGSDEVSLWRATRAALLDEDPAGTAPVFAATGALIQAYPEALSTFLAPIAAAAMVSGGELAAAGQFLASAPDTPPLALARASLLAAEGKAAAALDAYDRLANSPDRPVSARAASRAVLLRLATGAIDARAAAARLSRQFYAWRGGRHELGLRLKVADLEAGIGEWRQALNLLRRTQALFPDDAAAVRSARAATFDRLFMGRAADQVAPIDLVSLIEDNADLIPAGRAGEKFGEMLADRLLALDLPDRAEPVLAKLMAAAPPGVPQAGLGARLAAVRLGRNDPAGALAALAASRAADLPPSLAEGRTVLYARAVAAQGHTNKAVAALAAFDDPLADALRAKLLEKAKNWAGAEAALAALVSGTVPAAGPLSDTDRTWLVRLASSATEAGDSGGLTRLRAAYGPRMGQGPLADMFRLLTDPPARSLADLPQVTRETTIAEQLPNELKAIGATMRVVP